MKKKVRTEGVLVNFTKDELKRIDEFCERADVTRNAAIREAMEIVMEFEPEFMGHMVSTAKTIGVTAPLFMQQIITAMIAQESILVEMLPNRGSLIPRAFQYDREGKLLVGDDLSQLVAHQTALEIQSLLKKMKKSSDDKEEVRITPREAELLYRGAQREVRNNI